jgi:hypothetical protein
MIATGYSNIAVQNRDIITTVPSQSIRHPLVTCDKFAGLRVPAKSQKGCDKVIISGRALFLSRTTIPTQANPQKQLEGALSLNISENLNELRCGIWWII